MPSSEFPLYHTTRILSIGKIYKKSPHFLPKFVYFAQKCRKWLTSPQNYDKIIIEVKGKTKNFKKKLKNFSKKPLTSHQKCGIINT